MVTPQAVLTYLHRFFPQALLLIAGGIIRTLIRLLLTHWSCSILQTPSVVCQLSRFHPSDLLLTRSFVQSLDRTLVRWFTHARVFLSRSLSKCTSASLDWRGFTNVGTPSRLSQDSV